MQIPALLPITRIHHILHYPCMESGLASAGQYFQFEGQKA